MSNLNRENFALQWINWILLKLYETEKHWSCKLAFLFFRFNVKRWGIATVDEIDLQRSWQKLVFEDIRETADEADRGWLEDISDIPSKITANLISSRGRESQKFINSALDFSDTRASKFPKILVTISRHVRHQFYKISRQFLIKNCRCMCDFDDFALAKLTLRLLDLTTKRFAIVQVQDNIDLAIQYKIK